MQKSSNPKISIVIPCHKAEDFVYESILAKIKTLEKMTGVDYELIVVFDGRDDNSVKKVQELGHSKIRVFHYHKNRGKGFAVRFGMQKATGDFIGYIDCGKDIEPDILNTMISRALESDLDYIVPTKWHQESQINYPIIRKLYSRGYNMLLRFLLGIKVKDTQVGAKLYSRNLVKAALPRVLVKRFAFEAEFLSVARVCGFNKYEEIPVKINHDSKSTVRYIDGLHSIWDTFAIFYRLRIRRYYNRKGKFHRQRQENEMLRVKLL